MINLIKKIINKLRDPQGKKAKNDQILQYKKKGWLEVGENSDISNLNIDLRNPQTGKLYIKIGSNCIIKGNIIIESTEGQVFIDDWTYVGPSTSLIAINKISVGKYVMFAWGCTVIDHNSHSLDYKERMKDMERALYKQEVDWSVVKNSEIIIKDHAWIGFNTIIMKGVIMETSSVVGAGSVLTKSTEPYSVYGGNPAKFIKSIT